MTISAAALDADPYLLGVTNGILDLRTRTARPASPAVLVTKRTNVHYDPSADCPTWLAFLEGILPNADVRGYVQRIAGYLLTGLTDEQCFFFLYGTGANGKSTFAEVLRMLLGDYAVVIPTEVLTCARRDASAPSPDLMLLKGARMAVANETEEGSRFAESTLKHLTGGDTITARSPYGPFVTFQQTHKVIVLGNHRPVIRGTDGGIWRRLALTPFEVTIPPDERDPKLLEKLKAELPGILNWALDGLREYQELGGLKAPAAIKAAVAQYRQDMDIFGDWLSEQTVQDADSATKVADLYTAYAHWARAAGWTALTRHSFSRRLTERGFPIKNHGQTRARHALGLKLNQDGINSLCARG
jgi:putative DNA primase/helicase